MEPKLTWKEIEKRYDKEWVELVDYDWPEGNLNPSEGRVHVHADFVTSPFIGFYYYTVVPLNPVKASAVPPTISARSVEKVGTYPNASTRSWG